ncbi:hypothetical protein HY992_06460 [Candidatus Micrarchaeota archaeon]|nr:hypothetical protein [Candidatus Micrarchaeota archaeon]
MKTFFFYLFFAFAIFLFGCITPGISPGSIDFTGQPCGGVQGIPCPEGYSCEVAREEGDYTSDSFGACVKLSVQNDSKTIQANKTNETKTSFCKTGSSYLIDDLSCVCPESFEFDYSTVLSYKANAKGQEYEELETFAECVPLGNASTTLCVLGKLYEESASKRRECACPKGFKFDSSILGYDYNFSTGAESPIMGSTCVAKQK